MVLVALVSIIIELKFDSIGINCIGVGSIGCIGGGVVVGKVGCGGIGVGGVGISCNGVGEINGIGKGCGTAVKSQHHDLKSRVQASCYVLLFYNAF